jgi:hypothetical protein
MAKTKHNKKNKRKTKSKKRGGELPSFSLGQLYENMTTPSTRNKTPEEVERNRQKYESNRKKELMNHTTIKNGKVIFKM